MTTTPITTDSIESLGQYLKALSALRESASRDGLNDSDYDNRKYSALLLVAAHAQACEKTSTLVWRDEEGRYVAPGATDETSALIAVMLDHPDKETLFPAVKAGEVVALDPDTQEIINEVVSDFADHPEPI